MDYCLISHGFLDFNYGLFDISIDTSSMDFLISNMDSLISNMDCLISNMDCLILKLFSLTFFSIFAGKTDASILNQPIRLNEIRLDKKEENNT